jgi:hypothetical protein
MGTIFQREDRHGSCLNAQINRKTLYRWMLRIENRQHTGRNYGEIVRRHQQHIAKVERIRRQACVGHLKIKGLEGFLYEKPGRLVTREQNPFFTEKLRQLQLSAPRPSTLRARNYDQGFFEQNLRVQVIFRDRKYTSTNDEIDIAGPQFSYLYCDRTAHLRHMYRYAWILLRETLDHRRKQRRG